jgi:hypothetical protein
MDRRRSLISVSTLAATAFALLVAWPAGHAAAANTQVQTCPIQGNDPDTVTLTGPATLSPADNTLHTYGISPSETPSEANDMLPHGVTISFTITTIDTPGGSSTNNTDTMPSSGSASGDFTVTSFFQLRAALPGTARTYQIDWSASFDGVMGVSAHTCSSTDGTHRPFTVPVSAPAPALPETPWVAMLPLAGLCVGGATWFIARRKARRTS